MRLPTELEHVHISHISQLREYLLDPHQVITLHNYAFQSFQNDKSFLQTASFEDETSFKGGRL